jgi:serine protease
VLNLSLGGGAHSDVMEAAVAFARRKGAVVVCAAGNGGRGRVEYPAAYPGAIAVSAVGPSGELAGYSSWGKELDIAAPGGDKRLRGHEEDGILQNTIDPRDPSRSIYAFFNGTSMATPHVAGVAALLFAAGASSPDEVEKALFDGADHSKSGEWNDRFGHGALNAKGALDALGGKGGGLWWKKLLMLLWALILWLLTRLTLPAPVRRALKPGPGMLIAMALTVLGFFFLPWIGLGSVPGLAVLARPIPEWGKALFGGGVASALFFSALLPLLLSMVSFRSARLRGVLAGLAVGFAIVLLVRTLSGAPSILSVLWLILNETILLLLARAAMKSEGERA